MAYSYLNGKFYQDGQELPGTHPYYQMRKVGIDPLYQPAQQPQNPGLPENLSTPSYNPGLPADLTIPAQPQNTALQGTAGANTPQYTNVALQGDIPLGQLAQIGAAMPAGTTENTPGFLGIMTNAIQQGTAQPQTAQTGGIPQTQTQPVNTGLPMVTNPGLPVSLSAQVPATDPASYTFPQQTQASPYNDWMGQILMALQNMVSPAQGTMENYTPGSSYSELSQALQNRGMEMLNRPYGYTDAERQAIYDQAMNSFNMNNESDLNQLKNMYQSFGWNTGAPELGGQAMGSLNDYYKNREMALSDFTTNIMKDIADRRFTDEQAAVNNAMGINDQLYGQARGDFADTLSLMQFNQGAQQQQFNNLMDTMKFMSSEEQRNFLNQQGINDRELQDWYMQASQSYNQNMQNAEFTASQNQQQFSNQMAAAGFNAEQSQWLFQNQTTLAQLASQMSQQEFENTMMAANFTAAQAQTLWNNSQQVANTAFNQQVTSQQLADQGLNTLLNYNSQFQITPSDWMQMMGQTQNAQNQAQLASLSSYLNEPGMANLLVPLLMLAQQQGNTGGTTVNVNNGSNGATGTTPNNSTTASNVGANATTGTAQAQNKIPDWAKTLGIGTAAYIGKKIYDFMTNKPTTRDELTGQLVTQTGANSALQPMASELISIIPYVNIGDITKFGSKENVTAMQEVMNLAPIAISGVNAGASKADILAEMKKAASNVTYGIDWSKYEKIIDKYSKAA